MSTAHNVLKDRWDLTASKGAAPSPDARAAARTSRIDGSLQRVAPPADSAGAPATRQAVPQDWTILIERVQSAAKRTREVEAQTREQDLHVQRILDEVRSDIAEADERTRIAEAQLRDVQARAAAQIRTAEARAKAAEARAQSAEEWLARLQETILNEFADLTKQDTP